MAARRAVTPADKNGDVRVNKRPLKVKIGRRKKQPENRLNTIIRIVFVVLLVAILARGIFTSIELKAQEHNSQMKYKKVQQQKKDLERELKYINTPAYIEKAAREQLKMVKSGEMLFVFKDKNTEDDNMQAVAEDNDKNNDSKDDGDN